MHHRLNPLILRSILHLTSEHGLIYAEMGHIRTVRGSLWKPGGVAEPAGYLSQVNECIFRYQSVSKVLIA
jgi:hypothetical protein